MTSVFHPGQRWISASEPELGLGEVKIVSTRTVTVHFAAATETREYVKNNAPLRRAAFRVGDTVRSADGRTLVVEHVSDSDGLLSYASGDVSVSERSLSPTLGFSNPPQRLYAGVFDPPALFELRHAALQHQHRRRHSRVRGFLGGRIDLLPHQISIASEVTGRLLPRVLLADEVGLGKTIEACLIVHRLILTGRAQRILVLVQESLVHQWFLELLRRFSLWFHIFDEGRCSAIEEGRPGTNPFLEQQLVISDLSLLTRNPARLPQALEAGWDLIVVDEAHHLQWTPDAESPEYAAVHALGRRTRGLLLLTATPEQLGMTGHFARLRLLDPHRFHDLDAFVAESAQYLAVAERAKALLDAIERHPDRTTQDALDRLLDQHGTSRVIFRNTRATVSGFPRRLPHLHRLTLDVTDTTRRRALAREWAADRDADAAASVRLDFSDDPRIVWLLSLLRGMPNDKVLLICRTARKALAVEAAVRQHAHLRMGAFHEGLSLVQRDRAAAWFSEPDGARLLICSEIGSEGRNFQFAHHLVLFDLPRDPAVLEQRIGRLDRIGQQQDVHVHVPFIVGSHLEVLARWYDEGLNAFAENLQGSRELNEQFETRLLALADRPADAPAIAESHMAAFLNDVRAARLEVSDRLERGRDRLLEWQSFKAATAVEVIDEIRQQDEDRSLDAFMLAVFDLYMIEVEEVAPRTYRLGSAGVLVDDFPGLTSDRLTVTCDRQRALTREDMQFLTWDHPLTSGALDLVLGSDHGNCAFARWVDPVQELYLEAIYMLEVVAPAQVHADRFLPPTPLRVVVDRRLQNSSDQCTPDVGRHWLKKSEGGRELIGNEAIRERLLPRMMERVAALADEQKAQVVSHALTEMRTALESETARLRDLQKVNRAVRDDEIEALLEQQRLLDAHLSAARLRLDAVRVIHRGPIARTTT